MLFEDPGRRYPHLLPALNRMVREVDATRPQGKRLAMILVGLFALLAAIGPPDFRIPAILAAIVVMVGLRVMQRRRRQPSNERAIAAADVARRMGQLIARQRLHRDLDAGSLTILDECARQWLRARSALDAGKWVRPAPAYAPLRVEAFSAVDEAMQDALLHYRDLLPVEVVSRPAADYVDEALDNLTRGVRRDSRRGDDRFPPAAFGPVREIADRLRDFADEAERMARTADPEVREFAGEASSLERTLADLRAIREAEEELRQDVRH